MSVEEEPDEKTALRNSLNGMGNPDQIEETIKLWYKSKQNTTNFNEAANWYLDKSEGGKHISVYSIKGILVKDYNGISTLMPTNLPSDTPTISFKEHTRPISQYEIDANNKRWTPHTEETTHPDNSNVIDGHGHWYGGKRNTRRKKGKKNARKGKKTRKSRSRKSGRRRLH